MPYCRVALMVQLIQQFVIVVNAKTLRTAAFTFCKPILTLAEIYFSTFRNPLKLILIPL